MSQIVARLAFVGIFPLLFATTALGATTPIASLSANEKNYTAGQTATLTVEIDATAIAPTDEVVLGSYLGRVRTTLILQTSTSFTYQTSGFPSVGTYDWQVTVFTRNKQLAATLSQRITDDQADLALAEKELASTTDPGKQAALENEIAHDEQAISDLQHALSNLNILRETDSLPIAVAQ